MVRLSPRLCRAARSMLGWQQEDLATASGVSKSTIGAFETRQEDARLMGQNNRALIEAFERSGLSFIPENGGGAGIRWSHRANSGVLHAKPTGPATDVVDAMEDAISKDRARLASVKERGEEVPHEEWKRFEAADKKPTR